MSAFALKLQRLNAIYGEIARCEQELERLHRQAREIEDEADGEARRDAAFDRAKREREERT